MSLPPIDYQYRNLSYKPSTLKHHYGPNVHLLSDPFLLSLLARLCSPETHQPVIHELVQSIYSTILHTVVASEFPTLSGAVRTRMFSSHPEAVYQGPLIDPETSVVSVNLARAGTFPSHLCYTALNYFMNPKRVRQDHISIGRATDDHQQVTGSQVSGHKIGGDIHGAFVLFPDPMGATGSTIVEAMDLYKTRGRAQKYIALHCIVTPEYLKRVTTTHPDLVIYAARLDRGLSSPKILNSTPGEFWDEERGLNQFSYIVPGGGGFGEVMNNAYV
jgi:uracil phosphoribosyltransferase